MIIDRHGHYTTASMPHTGRRYAPRVACETDAEPPAYPCISDHDIRASEKS